MTYKRPDHFSKRARQAGYAARSVYKLVEIDRRFRIVPRPTGNAVDLGCYPGSWSRWLQEQGCRVIGVDLLVPEFTGTWLTGSAMEVEPDALRAHGPVDLLASDMAPNTTGNRFGDHCRQIELADRALHLATEVLRPGGHFVAKVFDGEDAPGFVARARAAFSRVERLKPEATRNRSVEFFVVGLGYDPARFSTQRQRVRTIVPVAPGQ